MEQKHAILAGYAAAAELMVLYHAGVRLRLPHSITISAWYGLNLIHTCLLVLGGWCCQPSIKSASACQARAVRHAFPLSAVCVFTGIEDVENELLKPAKQGTLNVLHSVSKSLDTVKRVVLTSSFAGEHGLI